MPAQRANGIWKQMLQDYQLPDFDESIDEALVEFMNERKNSFPDSAV